LKLRIQDNSVRFRVTIKELEELSRDGEIRRQTAFPSSEGCSRFEYAIHVCNSAVVSTIECRDGAIVATVTHVDLARLLDDATEGIYFRTEPGDDRAERFMFFIEKDRPAAACDKPEHWIYEERHGKPASTRPAGKPSGHPSS
jgi:hypothetical protein